MPYPEKFALISKALHATVMRVDLTARFFAR